MKIDIQEMAKIKLDKGDVVILKVKAMPVKQVETAVKYLHGAFPYNRVIFLDDKTEMSVVKSEVWEKKKGEGRSKS